MALTLIGIFNHPKKFCVSDYSQHFDQRQFRMPIIKPNVNKHATSQPNAVYCFTFERFGMKINLILSLAIFHISSFICDKINNIQCVMRSWSNSIYLRHCSFCIKFHFFLYLKCSVVFFPNHIFSRIQILLSTFHRDFKFS